MNSRHTIQYKMHDIKCTLTLIYQNLSNSSLEHELHNIHIGSPHFMKIHPQLFGLSCSQTDKQRHTHTHTQG